MEHLVKLLRDSYDLQEEKSEETAYWHLQKLRSEIKQLTLTDVVKSDSEQLLFSTDEIVSKINEQTVLDGETFRVYFCEK